MKIEYNNLYTHFVFSTLKRQALILEDCRIRIEKYITGIVNNNSCKLYAIYANPEHVHLLVSRSPEIAEEQLATIIADSSERFINENKLAGRKFARQRSASAFSVSKSHIDKVCKYILTQAEHHRQVTFAEEYTEFIKHYQETLTECATHLQTKFFCSEAKNRHNFSRFKKCVAHLSLFVNYSG